MTSGKYIKGLVILDTALLSAGFLITRPAGINLEFSKIAILILSFTGIVLLSLIIFSRGLDKEPGSQTMHILVAIVIKMLLEMILALLWFFVGKITGISSVLLFFVLYLVFSMYLIFYMLNTLKSKSL